jgi:ATP-binding cassette subfamily C protein
MTTKKILFRVGGTWRDSAVRSYVRTLLGVVAWWKVALALALALCITVTQGAQLLLLVPLMQLVGLDVQQGSIGLLAELVSSIFTTLGTSPTLGTVLVAFALVSAVIGFAQRWQTIFSYRLQMDFIASMRQRLYRAIANTNWLAFSRSRSSDFTHALTNELDRVGAATTILLHLITNTTLAMVYVLLALRLSLVMSVLVFFSGAVLLVALRKKNRVAQMTGKHISLATNGLYSTAIEHLGGMKTTKSYGAEERSANIFSGFADQVAQMNLNSIRNRADGGFWFSLGSAIILCVILYVAFEYLSISTAGLLLLLFLFNRIIPIFASIQQDYQQCLNVLPSFSGVMDILARCEAAAEPKTKLPKEVDLRNSVRFEAVSFAYGKDEKAPAIDGLNLTVRVGETTAIAGPSGAGKSTIADLVMGLIVPNQGRVLVDESPLRAELLWSWRNQIGYVAQDTFLFNDTVRANLLWACPEAKDTDITQALKLAAAEEFVSNLPKGIETVLGDRGVRLSGGERQRLALARALLRKPSLLILDEATSALDSENERRIQQAIDELHGHTTILVITHRLSTIRGADVIHVLEQGRLVESGGWEELVERGNGRFAALCRAQSIA